jgi:hypothetical protein
MCFLGTGAKYYGLIQIVPHKDSFFGVWSPAGGAILEVSGNFRRWNMAEEVGNKEWIFVSIFSLASFCVIIYFWVTMV